MENLPYNREIRSETENRDTIIITLLTLNDRSRHTSVISRRFMVRSYLAMIEPWRHPDWVSSQYWSTLTSRKNFFFWAFVDSKLLILYNQVQQLGNFHPQVIQMLDDGTLPIYKAQFKVALWIFLPIKCRWMIFWAINWANYKIAESPQDWRSSRSWAEHCFNFGMYGGIVGNVEEFILCVWQSHVSEFHHPKGLPRERKSSLHILSPHHSSLFANPH